MAFEEEEATLARVLGKAALHIEHVGSTAVPGLDAKPILDIAIAVESFDDAETWPSILAAEGYIAFGDREGRGERFFAKGPDECRTVYLHVVRRESSNWRNYLKFRDALRGDAKLRDEYARLKHEAAALHPSARKAYASLKDAWIARVLEDKSGAKASRQTTMREDGAKRGH